MLQYKSIKKIRLTTVSVLCLLAGSAFAADPIGDIVEQTGIGEIVRQDNTLQPQVGGDIILYDELKTGNGRMLVEFLDNEELALTEHTYAYIDEAYYDPDPSLSKMSLRMVMGTARFASGNGQLIKKSNIDVSTPTAQIAIRGTDFTTTIDEIGRSLVVLLPDRWGNSSGEITVFNDGGEIILNQPYQATMVSSYDAPPTTPVTISNITVNMIDNMFIVNPPQEVKQAVEEAAQDDLEKDKGILDVDFLEFNELEKDELKETEEDLEYSELDIDLLNVDLLVDVLDVIEELNKTVRGSQPVSGGSGLSSLQGAAIGLNKDSQYNVFIESDRIIFFRDVNGVIEISLNKDASVLLETIVEGYEGIITLGDGDDSEIIINQSN